VADLFRDALLADGPLRALLLNPLRTPPKKRPTFAGLEPVWQTRLNKSAEQKRKVISVRKDLTTTAAVMGLRDIGPESAFAFVMVGRLANWPESA
jgi:hypothetical protein